ncbi:MAG: transposase [Anaerolineae bacterium]
MARDEIWLRWVDGRPVSAITTAFLAWCCERLAARGMRVWVLIWDNAAWHISREVQGWLHAHNRAVKRSGEGVRILPCPLPVKSPWLNPIEGHWRHGKRQTLEPGRVLSREEMEARICTYYGCSQEPHLSIPEKVA